MLGWVWADVGCTLRCGRMWVSVGICMFGRMWAGGRYGRASMGAYGRMGGGGGRMCVWAGGRYVRVGVGGCGRV